MGKNTFVQKLKFIIYDLKSFALLVCIIITLLTKVIGSHLVFSFHADQGNKATELYFDSNLTPLTFPQKQLNKTKYFSYRFKTNKLFPFRKLHMLFLCLPSN